MRILSSSVTGVLIASFSLPSLSTKAAIAPPKSLLSMSLSPSCPARSAAERLACSSALLPELPLLLLLLPALGLELLELLPALALPAAPPLLREVEALA